MTKTTGMGDRLYIGGVDMSGDVGAIGEIGGGPTGLADITNNTQNAVSRIATTLAGRLTFDVWHDPSVSHPPLAALPTADVVATYINGPSQACSGLVARQVDYPPKRGTDGALSFTVQVLSDGSGLEWGRGYVGGPSRTDSAATNGAGVDDAASTSAGMAAYLHVLTFAGVSATVAVQHSNDNGATDPYTTIITFTAVTAAGNGQRVATVATLTIKRWIRVVSTGTFTVLTFHVMAFRGVSTAVIVTVDVQIFLSSGTWISPVGATVTYVSALAGGGGGGSGAAQASGTVTGGAGGGGGGAYSNNFFRTADLNATEAVTVGAGGTGGASVTSGNGASGVAGGSSSFGTSPSGKLLANRGLGGVRGITVTSAGGAGGLGVYSGGAGAGSTLGGAGVAPVVIGTPSGNGGASGGGIDSVPNQYAGANGGPILQSSSATVGIAGAAGGGNGTNGTSVPANVVVGGPGGGSGGSNITGNGGNGGNGGSYGGGGAGGGSCLTGNSSGAGGNGAPGIVMVVSW